MNENADFALAGSMRLIFGLTLMIGGLYFGLVTKMSGHGLGLLSFIASPFVFLTDKKRRNARFD